LSSATAERALASAEADRGSGLGLHVAQALMVRNWGTLELRNRIGGATFVLSLPAAADQRTAPSEPVGWDVAPHQAGSAVPQP
jgi:K+-sensing histidine kinase KdpD